jgi:HAD superfamily hydrolase (TIGR01509 family)
MDGVLVDSEPLHILAERKTLASFDLEIHDAEFQAYMGSTAKIMLGDMIRKHNLETTLDSLYPIHLKNLLNLYREKVHPIPGIPQLLMDFRNRDYPMAVASSSDQVLIRTVLEKFQWDSYFNAVVSGEEMERVKPYPDIFLEAARRLKAHPSQCVVIEDSTNGVRAAKAAGMRCIGFKSPNSHNQDLAEADGIVDDIRSLNLQALDFLHL